MKNFIKNQDGYGYRVGLHLRGRSTYRSMYGGTVTLLGRILLIYYLATQFILLANKNN